jgi:transposase
MLLTEVAERGLLKRHEPETIHRWIRRYLQAGVAGWQVKRGRGRKPKFSPSVANASRAAGGRDAP